MELVKSSKVTTEINMEVLRSFIQVIFVKYLKVPDACFIVTS